MFIKTWRRPFELKHPEVWTRFERKTKEGNVVKFRIETMTEKYLQDVKEMYMDDYMSDEVFQVISGGNQCPLNKQFYWRLIEEEVIPQEVILICVEDTEEDKPKLAGFNLCAVTSDDTEIDLVEPKKIESTWRIFRIYLDGVKSMVKVDEKYGTDKHMGSIALCVHRAYRGMGVAVEILKARVLLTKAMGMKLTADYFTGNASQSSAAKAGYFEEDAVSYEEISKNTGIPINCSNIATHLKQLSYKVD